MWPKKEREMDTTAAHKVAKSYPLYQVVKLSCCGSLININPSAYCPLRRYCTLS